MKLSRVSYWHRPRHSEETIVADLKGGRKTLRVSVLPINRSVHRYEMSGYDSRGWPRWRCVSITHIDS